VASIAADLLEVSLPGLSCWGRCESRIARRHFGSANELRKVVDVGQAEIVRLILGIGGNFTDRGGVVGPQSVGNTHFIHIGVADKREQAAVLIFPTEATDARLAGGLQHRNLDGLAVNLALETSAWFCAMVTSVLSPIASTEPSPRVLSAANSARIFSVTCMCFCAWRTTARGLMVERPAILFAPSLISTVGFTKLPLASLCPTRSSVNWLAAPLTGF
jgi:hypothetical protein